MHISPYEFGNINNVNPLRDRKLLLNLKEIQKLIGLTHQKGYTLIPVKLYFKNSFVKVQLRYSEKVKNCMINVKLLPKRMHKEEY